MPISPAATRVVRLGELLTTLDLSILVDGGGIQVDRWLLAMLFEYSVITWVVFSSTIIGFNKELSGTSS